MELKNTLLDDIAAEIGYTATAVLSMWFGRKRITVPRTPIPGHPLSVLVGDSAFRRLVGTFGGQTINMINNVTQVNAILISGNSTNTIVKLTTCFEKSALTRRHKER
jgi:hypothetical protein